MCANFIINSLAIASRSLLASPTISESGKLRMASGSVHSRASRSPELPTIRQELQQVQPVAFPNTAKQDGLCFVSIGETLVINQFILV